MLVDVVFKEGKVFRYVEEIPHVQKWTLPS